MPTPPRLAAPLILPGDRCPDPAAPPARRPLPPHRTFNAILPVPGEAVARRAPQHTERPFYVHRVLHFLPRHQPHRPVRIVGGNAVVNHRAPRLLWERFQVHPDADVPAVEALGLAVA